MNRMEQIKTKKKGLPAAILLAFLMLVLFFFGSRGVFAAEPVTAQIPVSQTFTDVNANAPSDTFTYTLTALTEGAPLPAGGSGGSYSFTVKGTAETTVDISCATPGQYEYRLSCNPMSDTGYTVDTTVYTISLYVHGDGRYVADVFVHMADNSKTATAAFSHTCEAAVEDPTPDPVLVVDPPVKKTIKGTPSEKATFSFALRARDRANPMPDGSSGTVKILNVTGEGEGEFGNWTYTAPGTYIYDVVEIPDESRNDYVYDTTVYTITDVVTLSNNTLSYERSVTAGDKHLEDINALGFTNEYTGDTGNSTGTSRRTISTSGDGSTTKKAGAVNTGDDVHILPWIILMIFSGAVIALVVILRKKKSRG